MSGFRRPVRNTRQECRNLLSALTMNDFIEKLCGKPKNLFVYKIAAHKERLQRVPTHQPFHALLSLLRPLVGKGMTKKGFKFCTFMDTAAGAAQAAERGIVLQRHVSCR